MQWVILTVKKDCNRSEVNVVKIIQIGLHEMKTNVVWLVKFEKKVFYVVIKARKNAWFVYFVKRKKLA